MTTTTETTRTDATAVWREVAAATGPADRAVAEDGVRLAYSSLTAIMGRMAAYTGQAVTWEMALNSQEALMPSNVTWDMTVPVIPMAMPGKTQFA